MILLIGKRIILVFIVNRSVLYKKKMKTILLIVLHLIFVRLLGQSDSTTIKFNVNYLCNNFPERNYFNKSQLDSASLFIYESFKQHSDSVRTQDFTVNEKTFSNVICSINTLAKERIIIGAHYDVCGNQQGADDNASGVAALLELARLFKNSKLNYRVDLVAYSLEEPPNFRTKNMGSYFHAAYLEENNISVKGMISLEMIGFFSEKKHTQKYPIGLLKPFYGSRGNYIAVVRKWKAGKFARRAKKKFKATTTIRTKSISAPKSLAGIDFSDHLWYWYFGFSAIMITDTSFYRNVNYHKKEDTPDKLDYSKMAKVIDGVYRMILKF